MKSKVLITGGSGFIGSNLLRSLLEKRNYELLNIDIKSSSNPEIQRITHICDIRNAEEVERIILDFNPEYIVHLAARTDLNGKTLEDYSSNITGVKNIIDSSKKLESLKRILITSSMLVCKAGYHPKSFYDYCPTTIYGESKVKTEEITRSSDLKCSWALLRPTSIWGPWFKVPYRNFFDMVRSKRYFHIGNRSCTKTYGYVGNTVYQIENILFKDNSKGQVFYLGDEPTNIEEWANEIAELENHKVIRMPYAIIKTAALFGDILSKIGIKFPMTSFRLKNMTTDNIIDLSNTDNIAPNRPFSRKDGVLQTLIWLDSN